MTAVGAMILGVYSLIVSIVLAVRDLIKVLKGKSKGWTFVVMIVVVIYLINTI